MNVVGLLPMGGNGTRLGMPFPKPLTPIITSDGIMPVYRHTLEHVLAVTDEVIGLVRPTTCGCLLDAILSDGLGQIVTFEENLPAALGAAGMHLSRLYSESTMIVVALPDSIWKLDPGKSLQDVVDASRSDGALALFSAGADQLDDVILQGPRVMSVVTKQPGATGTVLGWGAFVIRAGALAKFSDRAKDGPQLGELDMGWAAIGEYIDLGTVDRYVNHHDTRGWNA